MIIQYVREKYSRSIHIDENTRTIEKGKPIGCVVALDQTHIGFSVCREGDKWDRKKAVEIAKGRASIGQIAMLEKYMDNPYDFDERLSNEFIMLKKISYVVDKVKERANKYFKDGTN